MRREQKITFGEMRESGCTGVLVDCPACGHSAPMEASQWPDNVRLSDIEGRLVCQRCGQRGAAVRPHFPSARMGTAP